MKHLKKIIAIIIAVLIIGGGAFYLINNKDQTTKKTENTSQVYKVSEEEKKELKEKFDNLENINKETVGYIYIPGTKLDEPVVQTKDNETYLSKTFEGKNIPLLGAVFIDSDNNKKFTDRLTWFFGHARGSLVKDNRMFNDVNYFDKKEFFDKNKYVVLETKERKYYYEIAFSVVVPETTDLYRLTFDDDNDFKKQLETAKKYSRIKNDNVKIDAKDKWIVLSTCREEDPTIRTNLYARQIPDDEMVEFLKNHSNELKYQKTR